MTNTAADRALSLLAKWLDAMRGRAGYGGPVVHWWRDSLSYCGPGFDWRYEGIIAGYLSLHQRTGSRQFLDKAKRAGDDLVAGQMHDGSFRSSSFERNPQPCGTPHEAAADIGLLLLARELRESADPSWHLYLDTAERNIRGLIRRLWSETERRFSDGGLWFVPNKAATVVEALCLLAELTANEEYVARFVRGTADAIVAHQLHSKDHLDGAIAQASHNRVPVEKYFPYYVTRCIPGLCAAYSALGEARYLEGATQAAAFLLRCREIDGAMPQVLYPRGRANRYPRWIAANGDVLRALSVLKGYGFTSDSAPTLAWMLQGQLPSGAFRAADGFAGQVSQKVRRHSIELRDVLPVVGWNDKAFRALADVALIVEAEQPQALELQCTWTGEDVLYSEDAQEVRVSRGGSTIYSWRKGESWAHWQ